MKSQPVQNIIVDEANQITYVVMARRLLSDGEVFSAIRVELLTRQQRPHRGETLVIEAKHVE